MKWIEFKVEYEEEEDIIVSELISDVFYEMGIKGVAIYDGMMASEDEWAEDAIPISGPHSVIGYFPDDRHFKKKSKDLENRLAAIKTQTGIRYAVRYSRLNKAGWADAWKKYFWPIRVGKHLVIKPTWRRFKALPGDMILKIDPGMAFGTGSHATTVLCLELIEKYLLKGDAFLDVGTGSGILMVAAASLGAGRVVGVDKDETAVTVAEKNLILNRIAKAIFQVKTGNLVENISETFDMIAANILTEVIVSLLRGIPKILNPGGTFICSGMIDKNTHRVEKRMAETGFDILEIMQKEGWVAIAAKPARKHIIL